MPIRKTYEQVKADIENTDCKLVSKEYRNTKTKLDIECVCGHIFSKNYDHFMRSSFRCQKCSGKYHWTIDELKLKVNDMSEAKLISNGYKNNHSLLTFECKCGNHFKTSWKSFIKQSKRTCDECTHKLLGAKSRTPQNIFAKRVNTTSKGKITVLGEYTGMSHKVKVKHNECGTEWHANPSDLLHKKSSCPKCNNSRGETKIRDWLLLNKIEFKEQYKIKDCKNKRALPFDFAVFYQEELHLLIEYDGIAHYDHRCFGGKGFSQLKKNDKIKTDYCNKNNIKLVRIPYTRYEQVETILKKDILL